MSDGLCTLEDLLHNFVAQEPLIGDNIANCRFCGQKSASSKTLAIASTPVVLLVHLKRFHTDGRRRNNPVSFPWKVCDFRQPTPQHQQQAPTTVSPSQITMALIMLRLHNEGPEIHGFISTTSRLRLYLKISQSICRTRMRICYVISAELRAFPNSTSGLY